MLLGNANIRLTQVSYFDIHLLSINSSHTMWYVPQQFKFGCSFQPKILREFGEHLPPKDMPDHNGGFKYNFGNCLIRNSKEEGYGCLWVPRCQIPKKLQPHTNQWSTKEMKCTTGFHTKCLNYLNVIASLSPGRMAFLQDVFRRWGPTNFKSLSKAAGDSRRKLKNMSSSVSRSVGIKVAQAPNRSWSAKMGLVHHLRFLLFFEKESGGLFPS